MWDFFGNGIAKKRVDYGIEFSSGADSIGEKKNYSDIRKSLQRRDAKLERITLINGGYDTNLKEIVL